jgi:hypothetical protein
MKGKTTENLKANPSSFKFCPRGLQFFHSAERLDLARWWWCFPRRTVSAFDRRFSATEEEPPELDEPEDVPPPVWVVEVPFPAVELEESEEEEEAS